MKTSTFVLAALFGVTLVALFLLGAHSEDIARLRLADCIAGQAIVHHFIGDPYGADAWQEYEPYCNAVIHVVKAH